MYSTTSRIACARARNEGETTSNWNIHSCNEKRFLGGDKYDRNAWFSSPYHILVLLPAFQVPIKLRDMLKMLVEITVVCCSICRTMQQNEGIIHGFLICLTNNYLLYWLKL